MYRFPKYVRKIVKMGGKSHNIENVVTHARRLTNNRDAIDMLISFYTLLVDTNFLPQVVYDALVKGEKAETLARKYNMKRNSVYKAISRQYKRIDYLIPYDLIEVAQQSKEEEPHEHLFLCQDIIRQLISTQQPHHIREFNSLFTFDLETYSVLDREFNHKVDNPTFEHFVESMKMTSQPYLEEFLFQVDRRLVGYAVHLLKGNESNLTNRDLQRKKFLEQMWKISEEHQSILDWK